MDNLEGVMKGFIDSMEADKDRDPRQAPKMPIAAISFNYQLITGSSTTPCESNIYLYGVNFDTLSEDDKIRHVADHIASRNIHKVANEFVYLNNSKVEGFRDIFITSGGNTYN